MDPASAERKAQRYETEPTGGAFEIGIRRLLAHDEHDIAATCPGR
jgi:hypothetical protein